MNKIGIDFGTSYCSASRLNPATGKPEVITFHETGRKQIASLVYYSQDGPLVGDVVAEMLENCGRYPEEEREDLLSFTHVSVKRQLREDMRIYDRVGNALSQSAVIVEILRKIKKEVEEGCFCGQQVEAVVLTYPVRFSLSQREMLREAACLAGFQQVEMMEEPVAAAKGYAAAGENIGKGILVYDFGGGTFDVAYVTVDDEGEYRVPIPAEGDLYCGGDDIDTLLYRHYEKEVRKLYGRSIHPGDSGMDVGFLRRCRSHKQSLSVRNSINEFEILPPPDPKTLRLQLDRATFERVISPLIDRTVELTESLLRKVKDAGFKVDTVVLIGGSSRIPLVAQKLKDILPVALLKTMYVDSAVVMGAIVPDKIYTHKELEEMCRKALLSYQADDINEAMRLWKKAALGGIPEAQFNLGVCYQQGWGVEKDCTQALAYYEASADGGNESAFHNGAVILLDDLKSTKEWERLFGFLQANKVLAQDNCSGLRAAVQSLQVEWKITLIEKGPDLTDMVLVKGGTFEMGTNYKVTLSNYYIGKYPVTQKLWKEVMGSNPSYHKGDDLLPVEEISWFDAVLFCNKLSQKRGVEECYRISGSKVEWLKDKRGYRLLTEAEWEYAAGGGKESKKFSYNNELDEVGWYNKNSGGKSHPVGTKKPNSLGLCDMSGNVWEWCWDWHDVYSFLRQTNPSGPATGSLRVYRGGSWYNRAGCCAVSYRLSSSPGHLSNDLGLRLAFTCLSK